MLKQVRIPRRRVHNLVSKTAFSFWATMATRKNEIFGDKIALIRLSYLSSYFDLNRPIINDNGTVQVGQNTVVFITLIIFIMNNIFHTLERLLIYTNLLKLFMKNVLN